MLFSKIKNPGSALTHFIAFLGALVASVPLLMKAAAEPDRIHLASMAIFIASMILLYAASTIYHTLDISEKINKRLRKLDQEGKLNGDVIDGILMEEKKEVDKVIINSAELEKYFGKDKSPRQMKDQIMALLDDWKAKQPPELGKPEKKTDKSL